MRTVLLSGFGPFERFDVNPSAEVARALSARPPRGMRVRAAILPVSFARAPRAWDRALADGEEPALYVGLGVASRSRMFRLERRAGPALKRVPRPDVDGRAAAEFSAAGPSLDTGVDLARLLAALRRRGVTGARISRTAGGYVCERIYHHLLVRAAERGVPALFVHVPPARRVPIARQVQVVRWVLEELRSVSLPAGSGDTRRGRRAASPRRRARPRRKA